MGAAARPLVSIITPTYQHAAYIRECLESVIAQTYGDWELIVVDDGSTDGTLDEVARVIDPRIRVLAREHSGIDRLADTYNAGVAQARGTLFAFVEGDDRWVPDKLERQVEIMRDPDLVLTYARYAVFGSHGRVLSIPPLAGPAARGSFDALPATLLDSFVEVMTVLVRRGALQAVGGFRQLPGHPHIDYATFLALAELGPFFADDQVVSHWRRHLGSFTVQAVTAPRNFDGPRLCMEQALVVRHRRTDRDLPDDRAIIASWANVLARRYWHSGRVLQAQRQWGPARRLYGHGLRVRTASGRQRALLLLGAATTAIHLDLEPLIRRLRGGAPLSDL